MYQIHVAISQIKIKDTADSIVIAIPTQVFSNTNPPLQQQKETRNPDNGGQRIKKIPFSLILKENGANQLSCFQRLQEQIDCFFNQKQSNIKEQERRENTQKTDTVKSQAQITRENQFNTNQGKQPIRQGGNQISANSFNRNSSADPSSNNNSFSPFLKNSFSNSQNNPMSNNFFPNTSGPTQMNIFSHRDQQNNRNSQTNVRSQNSQPSQKHEQIFSNNFSLKSSERIPNQSSGNIFLPSTASDNSLFSASNNMNRSSTSRSTSRGKRPNLS